EIDFDLKDPARVGRRLGDALQYAQRVESLVTGLSIETLLPRVARGDYVSRFLTIWQADEQGHSRALAHLLKLLGFEPEPDPVDEPVPLHNRRAGLLGQASLAVHRVVELVYHTVGAMNEKLAFTAYERMAVVLDDMGEHGLSDT